MAYTLYSQQDEESYKFKDTNPLSKNNMRSLTIIKQF